MRIPAFLIAVLTLVVGLASPSVAFSAPTLEITEAKPTNSGGVFVIEIKVTDAELNVSERFLVKLVIDGTEYAPDNAFLSQGEKNHHGVVKMPGTVPAGKHKVTIKVKLKDGKDLEFKKDEFEFAKK